MKLNSILYFILISYINSSTIITISDEFSFSSSHSYRIPFSELIESNYNSYFIYCFDKIFILDYINNDQKQLLWPNNYNWYRSFEIDKNTSIIYVSTSIITDVIKNESSGTGYLFQDYSINNLFDVFSIV